MQARWQALWFGPTDPRPLALLRIGLALVAIHTHLSWWPEVATLLDPAGMSRLVVSPEHGRGLTFFAIPGLDARGAWWVHAATLVPLVGLLFGVGGRWMALAAWLVVVGWYHRTPGASTGGDRLLRFALLYLFVGRCTARWSVDALWQARRHRGAVVQKVCVLPLRLVQVQWAVMYLLSGIDKARGRTWRDGTALHYALSNRTFARVDGLFDAIVASPTCSGVLHGATWLVLAWELGFAVLVWGRTSRRIILTVGILVHLGIGLSMEVGPFTAVTLVGYLAFTDRWKRWQAPSRGMRDRPDVARVQSFAGLDEYRTATEPVQQESP